jgi:hypothetical protein
MKFPLNIDFKLMSAHKTFIPIRFELHMKFSSCYKTYLNLHCLWRQIMRDRQNHGNTVFFIPIHFLEVFLLCNYGISHTKYTLYITVHKTDAYNRLCAYVPLSTKQLEVYLLIIFNIKYGCIILLLTKHVTVAYFHLCLCHCHIAGCELCKEMWVSVCG